MHSKLRWFGRLLWTAPVLFTGCQPAQEDPATPAAVSVQRLLPEQLSPIGRWFVDSQGRVRMFRGVNMVNKVYPYTLSDLGFGDADAELMEKAGFNLVRVGLIYSAIEPTPGNYDDAYLDSIAATVALLANRGMYSLLEFHQDLYGSAFNAAGFPVWATLTDELPREPLEGFPGDYYRQPAIARAFDNFWNNAAPPEGDGRGLQEYYAAAWNHVAARFAGVHGVFGYELMNEPFPGSKWSECTLAGCASFDPLLADFYTRVIREVRNADVETMLAIEPNVMFTLTDDTLLPAFNDGRLMFSFHPYGVPERGFNLANARASSKNEALIASEWGAKQEASQIQTEAAAMDRHRMSWLYWTWANNAPYDFSDDTGLPADPAEQGVVYDLSAPRDASNVYDDRLAALTRPYPRAVAGTPTVISFDPTSRIFNLSYWTSSVAGGRAPATAQTEIFVPERHYPNGYQVTVIGATVVSASGSRVLQLVNNKNATAVTARVNPR